VLRSAGEATLTQGPWIYRRLRDQLGSIRKVYVSADRVERRDDFAGREVVLLLHGFFQTRNIWEVMEDRLRHDGYSVMSFDVGGLLARFNTKPVDRLAVWMAAKIEGLAARHGFEAIHVIGHSKGGLVARRYIQHHGGGRRVKGLITLGTPHHGAPTAIVAMPLQAVASVSELMPYSKVVRALNRDTFPAHVPLTSIYSTGDLVCPSWASVLRPRDGESSMSNVRVTGIGHSQLTWDPGVYRVVHARLQEATRLWNERSGAAPSVTD
jgi:triacylglycerol esterase/lipase EstA (alpha/beta hydrolase family)